MSNPIKDGGPAFPRGKDAFGEVNEGMTLRDWFAGQALAGLMVRYDEHPNTVFECAKYAYEAADAMIAAREVKPS